MLLRERLGLLGDELAFFQVQFESPLVSLTFSKLRK
jgi:hypothetical protein